MNVKEFFSKTWPIIQGILIFSASIVMVVYGVLSAPDRETIRALGVRVNAVETQITKHEDLTGQMMVNTTNAFDQIKIRLDSINSRLSRIEGRLEK